MSVKERSKPVNLALWALSILGAALFVAVGVYKLADGMAAQFAAWGFPAGFDAAIGTLELVGGLMLLSKRTAGWSATGLMVLMAGAFWVHLTHGETLALVVPSVTFVCLGLIAWGRGLPIRTEEGLEDDQSSAMASHPHPLRART